MPRTSGIELPNLTDDSDELRGAGFAEPPEDEAHALHPAALDAESCLVGFELALRAGRPWFEALLDAIRRWDIPREIVDGREYVYLIEREAFDWLLLCERLCDAMPAGLLPADEVEALLTDETPPQTLSEDEFRERIGPAKYWAHLNFLYGVRVEQALQLAVERALQKETGAVAFSHGRRDLERDAHARIYGATQEDLLRDFRDRADHPHTERITQQEWQAFTYWLFRRRVEQQDPARVASDTRRGLDMLRELELAARRRQTLRQARRAEHTDAHAKAQSGAQKQARGRMEHPGAREGYADPGEVDVIDSVVVAVG